MRVEARSGSAEFPREGWEGGCWFHKHARSLGGCSLWQEGSRARARAREREGEGEGEGVDVRGYEGGGGGLWEGRDFKESEGCGLKA